MIWWLHPHLPRYYCKPVPAVAAPVTRRTKLTLPRPIVYLGLFPQETTTEGNIWPIAWLHFVPLVYYVPTSILHQGPGLVFFLAGLEQYLWGLYCIDA